jgi:hypothetical protein
MVTIETRATVSLLKESLTRLSEKIEELNSDISLFNIFVKKQVLALNTRGESADILTSLFRAYRSAKDVDFVSYVKDVERRWEDGSIAELSHDELMEKAENKFKTQVEKGSWMVPTKEEEQWVVLQAAYTTLQKDAKALKKASEKTGSARTGGGTTRPQTQKWKMIAPKGSEPKHRTVNGKEYVHCPFHEKTKWVLKEGHAQGCRLDPEHPDNKGEESSEKKKKASKHAKAMAHIQDDGSDEEGSDFADEDL